LAQIPDTTAAARANIKSWVQPENASFSGAISASEIA
jgi:hypothetical protein